jgi:hypothetical protein
MKILTHYQPLLLGMFCSTAIKSVGMKENDSVEVIQDFDLSFPSDMAWLE